MKNKIRIKIKKIKITNLIKNVIEFLTALSTVTGLSIFGGKSLMSIELENVNTRQEVRGLLYVLSLIGDYMFDNWLMILTLTSITMFIFKGCCEPLLKIYIKDVPPLEAKPSIFEIVVLAFVTGGLVSCYVLTGVVYAGTTPLGIKIEGDFGKEEADDSDKQLFVEQDEKIEDYIIRCSTEIVPVDEWNNLSDYELFLIRNGIFAYSGRVFKEEELIEYYKRFSWYEARYTSDEVANYISINQWKNIENIKLEEKRR